MIIDQPWAQLSFCSSLSRTVESRQSCYQTIVSMFGTASDGGKKSGTWWTKSQFNIDFCPQFLRFLSYESLLVAPTGDLLSYSSLATPLSLPRSRARARVKRDDEEEPQRKTHHLRSNSPVTSFLIFPISWKIETWKTGELETADQLEPPSQTISRLLDGFQHLRFPFS